MAKIESLNGVIIIVAVSFDGKLVVDLLSLCRDEPLQFGQQQLPL